MDTIKRLEIEYNVSPGWTSYSTIESLVINSSTAKDDTEEVSFGISESLGFSSMDRIKFLISNCCPFLRPSLKSGLCAFKESIETEYFFDIP